MKNLRCVNPPKAELFAVGGFTPRRLNYFRRRALLVLRSPAKRDVGGCSLLLVALRSVRDRPSNGVLLEPWRSAPEVLMPAMASHWVEEYL